MLQHAARRDTPAVLSRAVIKHKSWIEVKSSITIKDANIALIERGLTAGAKMNFISGNYHRHILVVDEGY